jgi:signal peptidase I
VKKQLKKRSIVLTGMLVALAAVGWHYFAPSNIGGGTRYVVTSGISMQPHFHTGDLAIVRPASNYKVGEIVAYHSTLLHVTVLHRIIARHGNRYVFKGDNNNFIDPVQPTRSELLGKLWLHIPHGGVFFKALHAPMVAAVIAALLGMFVLFGFSEQRRRRDRRQRGTPGPSRPGLSLMNGPRHQDGTRPVNHDAFLAASAFAVAAFAVLALFALTRPAVKPSAKITPYTQQVSFAYSAEVTRSPVFPAGKIRTGDPIFLSMVHQLDLDIGYHLSADAPTSLTGTAKVAMTLSGPSGWSRTFVLTPRTRFTGASTSTDVVLNLPKLVGLQNQIARLTGAAAFSNFSLAVGPAVQVAGVVGGHEINTGFSPMLNFQFVGGQLQISGAAGGSPGASSASTASSAPSSATFAPQQTGRIATPTTAPNTLDVFGVSARVDTLRLIAVIGLLLSIAATLYFYLRKRGEPFEESFRIQAKYGHMLIPIVGGEDLGWPPVEVSSIKALVKLAESGQRLILHNRSDDADTYMVNEEGTVYRYQVKPSNVVWGDWSDGAEPVKAAA